MKLAVRPFIPNPLRCFKCQRFGHSQTNCRGALTCARCAEQGHISQQCTEKEMSCPRWKQEKEIMAVKTKEQISYLQRQNENSWHKRLNLV
ncbi:hypothetical protein AVEN_257171-1 [Araneus ventricosus]|uniref:CCHC-type domain-containing protein n=1 Tax=Araneus ventricosus TaxID=182803 RepID=A0A4Y2UQE6_ARAVE|nr:hypothetical protein AVEN_257171-1 [Araneus ventricosus]